MAAEKDGGGTDGREDAKEREIEREREIDTGSLGQKREKRGSEVGTRNLGRGGRRAWKRRVRWGWDEEKGG